MVRASSVAKLGERVLTLKEIDPAHVARLTITAVVPLHEARHLAESGPSFGQATLELLGGETGF
jgi:hypothetical protein